MTKTATITGSSRSSKDCCGQRARSQGLRRPACLECVEKHVGAAQVLLLERDYPHHLRAIGHLAEAEEECGTWPALRELIREQRKAFQREGRPVDFARIAELLEITKRGEL